MFRRVANFPVFLWISSAYNARAAVLNGDLNRTNPVPAYTYRNQLVDCRHDIQDAIDGAALFRRSILVRNGIYQTGGRVV